MSKTEDLRNKRLFAGEWIFSKCERMAYKLDKQGTLIFNCKDGVSEDQKTLFSIAALTHLGIDRDRAEAIANVSKGNVQ